MPRYTSKSTDSSTPGSNRRITRVERDAWWRIAKRLLLDRRTRMVVGIILFSFAVFAALAYISFLFTSRSDQSLLSMPSEERITHRMDVQNVLGLPGARLANFLVNGSFGFSSILFVFMLAVYGLRMMHVLKDIRAIKLFCGGTFWVLWGSIVLAFVQYIIHAGTILWGGTFGKWMAEWMHSYVQTIGMLLILVVTLVIFLVVTDPRFIDRCKTFGKKIQMLFQRKPKVEAEVETETEPEEIATPEESTDEQIVELPIEINDTKDAEPNEEVEDIPITIDEPRTEETTEKDQDEELEPTPIVEQSTDEDQTEDKDPDLEIEDTPVEELYDKDPDKLLAKIGPYDPRKDLEFYKFPSLNLLKVYDNENAPLINEDEQRANGARIVTTLRNYGIEIESIKATVGPTVTLYEIVPKAGVRVAKIQSLENDIMLSLSATGIRIIAPMPGKGTIGIEVPNETPQTVSMHSVIASKRFQDEQKMKLPIAYGRTITNEVFMFDLAKTPHLLVAGATGTGKSVAINAIITSLLYKKHPAELKMVLVDPKMVEFAPYKPLLKHYLAAMPDADPNQVVITDCDKVVNTLNSLVIEMENRYKLLMAAGVRTIEDYNDKFTKRRLNPNKLIEGELHHQYLPYIVMIIDEYGDFIMQAGKQVETPIARITQKARAVGMHMILATQRPSVNIVTGVIKANIPTRIALRTQSVIDSRTVLDAKGAEQLIGRGDSLHAGNASITRVQCAFVDTPEVDRIVEHIAKQQRYTEPYQLPEYVGEGGEGEALAPGSVDMKRLDPMFADVARYVVTKQEGSTSRLQRAFEIGYNRAGKLSDQLEAAGVVGPNKGPKGRDVLIQDLSQLDLLLAELGVK